MSTSPLSIVRQVQREERAPIVRPVARPTYPGDPMRAGETLAVDFDNGVRLQGHSSTCLDVVPFYSTDPTAMMLVVEKMRERFGVVEISWGGDGVDPANIICTIMNNHGDCVARAETNSAALSVCRCALLAVEQTGGNR